MNEMRDVDGSGGWRWSNGVVRCRVKCTLAQSLAPGYYRAAAAAWLSSLTFQQLFRVTCLRGLRTCDLPPLRLDVHLGEDLDEPLVELRTGHSPNLGEGLERAADRKSVV